MLGCWVWGFRVWGFRVLGLGWLGLGLDASSAQKHNSRALLRGLCWFLLALGVVFGVVHAKACVTRLGPVRSTGSQATAASIHGVLTVWQSAEVIVQTSSST